jgi:hypothetical protein
MQVGLRRARMVQEGYINTNMPWWPFPCNIAPLCPLACIYMQGPLPSGPVDAYLHVCCSYNTRTGTAHNTFICLNIILHIKHIPKHPHALYAMQVRPALRLLILYMIQYFITGTVL